MSRETRHEDTHVHNDMQLSYARHANNQYINQRQDNIGQQLDTDSFTDGQLAMKHK